MIIRESRIEDLEHLKVLFDNYRIFYRKESDLKGAEEFISERISNGDSVIYVCETSEKQLCGFVQLYPLFSSTRMKKLWLLNDLYVSKEARGLGVSKMLIEKSKELVRESGASGMFLETERSNDVGNKLYPSVGFRLNQASNFYEWEN